MNKMINKMMIVLFVGFIFVVSIANVFNEQISFSNNENRYLSQFPSFTWDSFLEGKYTKKFEDFIQDQFVERDFWIVVKAVTSQAFLKLENNEVYLAKDENLIDQFILYDEEQLIKNIGYINRFEHPVSLMIVPSAASVNASLLQPYSYNTNEDELLALIESSLFDHVSYVDVASALKNTENSYFRTDHHWNYYGSYLGYQAFVESIGLEAISQDYEVVSDGFKGSLLSKSGLFYYKPDEIMTYSPLDEVNVTITFEDGSSYDTLFFEENLLIKDEYTYYLDGNHALVEIVNHDIDNDETLLVVKDSFAHIMVPYLVNHYKTIIMVDLRYNKMSISDMIGQREVDETLILYSLDNFTSDKNIVFLK
ncbi:MAG: DHHW family protein [Erysipelotrichaceae bacterium]